MLVGRLVDGVAEDVRGLWKDGVVGLRLFRGNDASIESIRLRSHIDDRERRLTGSEVAGEGYRNGGASVSARRKVQVEGAFAVGARVGQPELLLGVPLPKEARGDDERERHQGPALLEGPKEDERATGVNDVNLAVLRVRIIGVTKGTCAVAARVTSTDSGRPPALFLFFTVGPFAAGVDGCTCWRSR